MATVGGLTNSTANSIRGYGGLASGMDRDTLIEGMTYGTTSKITQQQQKKQQLEWKQNAVRAISDMMIAFANKYTASFTSSNNLFSSMLWGRNNITTTGANSKFISVTGTASAADAITIMGVKQMAQDAKWSSSHSVSDKKLQTGEVGTTLDRNGMDGDEYVVQELVGKTLDFQYGDKSFSVTLGLTDSNGNLYDYRTADGIKKALDEQLSKVEVDDNTKLSDLVHVKASSDGTLPGDKPGDPAKNNIIEFTGTNRSNTLEMTGGSALELLGFKKPEDKKDEGWALSDTAQKGNALVAGDLSRNISLYDKIADKELTFSYNGTTKTITMPSGDDLKGADGKVDLEKLRGSIEDQLDSAFGKGRIKVGLDGKNLSFTTYNPATNKVDETSTLTLVSGSSDLVGANGVLGMKEGMTNRVNLNEKLVDAGLGLDKDTFKDGKTVQIKVNDADITIDEKDTVNSLLKKINDDPKAGVTVSYQTVGDKFTFTSTEKGASGKVAISSVDPADAGFLDTVFGAEAGKSIEATGQDAVVAVKYKGSDDVVELIRDSNSFTVDGLSIGVKGTFGYKDVEETTTVQNLAGKTLKFKYGADEYELTLAETKANGGKYSYASVDDIRNAINTQLKNIELKDGSGKHLSDVISVGKDSGGLKITANGVNAQNVEFVGGDSEALELLGLNGNQSIAAGASMTGTPIDTGKLTTTNTVTEKVYDNSTEEVQINAQVNTDNIVDSIKSMVDEYNKIIELVNKELTTKPDRDYAPLTSEQKKELSESEIETWEEKAKSGMLYGDSDLRSLSSDLRFIISGGSMENLRKIGITTSSLYSDNGKLTLDETKLRAALETDPESVEKLFTAPEGSKDEKGNDITGIATNLKKVMDKYVKTLGSMDTKGILIKKAGSTSSPMSLTENTFYKQLAEINKQISKLQTRLETERDRYIKQFTSLETLISQMNSQSGWLSQLGGY